MIYEFKVISIYFNSITNSCVVQFIFMKITAQRQNHNYACYSCTRLVRQKLRKDYYMDIFIKYDMQGLIQTGCFRYTLLFVCFSSDGKNSFFLMYGMGDQIQIHLFWVLQRNWRAPMQYRYPSKRQRLWTKLATHHLVPILKTYQYSTWSWKRHKLSSLE